MLHGPASQPATRDRPASAAPTATNLIAAVGLLIAAVSLFSALDTVAKLLVTRHGMPLAQIVWLRFVGQTVYMIAIFGPARLPDLLRTRRLPLQLSRSVLMIMTTACNFFALQTLRLDQTITIVFLAPLVVAALAGPLLGEWVGWRRGLAILTGFIGVVVAMHPGGAPLSLAVAVSFLGMLAYAAFMLLTRHLAAIDRTETTLFYSMLVGTVAGAPFAVQTWVTPPDFTTWAMLASLGALGGAGHLLFILAYSRAPASAVSPFLYVQLLTMVASGYLVFGDVPDGWAIIGASIVVASGIYLVHRERVVGRGLAKN